jgi:methylthioribose-1-phosphate isomerase
VPCLRSQGVWGHLLAGGKHIMTEELEDLQSAVRTVEWKEDEGGAAVHLLDQTRLPASVVYVWLRHEREVADAIVGLKVRGAPAIGVTAAYGVALAAYCALYQSGGVLTCAGVERRVREAGELLRATRPTAVNLFWAIERMQQRAAQLLSKHCTPAEMVQSLIDEAHAINREDAAACLSMGRYGATLIADGDALLTHCNAGALATTGLGTALAPCYVAHKSGKRLHMFVDETRPVLQGARLTAWELQQEGVPFTLITDNMAGYFMQRGEITAVFVGADRIAANGDTANKIGTYSLAVLAQAHAIPFYVVAPCSTLDLRLATGEQVPIEQRKPSEVTEIRGVRIAPPGVQVANPAFDVTPHRYISAIITERGIARPPYDAALRQMLGAQG